MAVDLSCFDGVLGLASCECPCLTEIAPEGYNDATSGLYIADLIPLSMLDGAENCSDPSNPWNLLDNARTQGANELLKDIKAGLMKKNQFTREVFTGMIGERSARDTVALTKTYAGVRISAPRIKGGYMHLTRIGGVFNATGSISVQIYNQFNETVGSPIAITTTAGGHGSTVCDITLPLWVDGADHPEYFLAYTVDQNNLPRANRLFCPTCSKNQIPTFSLDAPYYTKPWRQAQSWANWVMIGSWEGDTLTDFDLESTFSTTGSGMNGLTITCSFTCDPSTAVCLGELDFNDPVSMSLAHAYRYISAIKAAEKIIRNPEPYRNAAVSKEVLAVDILQWWTDYKTNVEYVIYNANQKNTDCIFCKPKFSMGIESKLP